MKTLIVLLITLILLITFTSSHYVCYSTGDPHYKTFSGVRKDLYGVQGDLLLTRSSDNKFIVNTRMKYGQYWRNRALNIAVAFKMDGNIFEHYGSYYKLNGKKNTLSGLKNRVYVKASKNKFYFQSKKTSIKIEFSFGKVNNRGKKGWPSYYFNVYVGIPGSYVNKMDGICGTGIQSRSKDISNWNYWTSKVNGHKNPRSLLRFKDKLNIFDHHAKVKRTSWRKIGHISWPNKSIKDKAYHYCKTLYKLKKNTLKNCLYDAKVSGCDMNLMKGYQNFAREYNKMKKPKWVNFIKKFQLKDIDLNGIIRYDEALRKDIDANRKYIQ